MRFRFDVVEVFHRRLQVCVSHALLQSAQIDPAPQSHGRIGVPQAIYGDTFVPVFIPDHLGKGFRWGSRMNGFQGLFCFLRLYAAGQQ